MRYIRLTEEEKQRLTNLHKTSTNSVVRERSFMLLLSGNGMYVNEISSLFKHTRHTVSKLLSTWENGEDVQRFEALRVAKGRGAKVRLSPVAEMLPELVEKHSRNLKPILAILENEYSIKVSKQTLQNFLKGAGL
jgi:transposase